MVGELLMGTYEVSFTAVVAAGSRMEAMWAARQLIIDDRFEPVSVVLVDDEADEGEPGDDLDVPEPADLEPQPQGMFTAVGMVSYDPATDELTVDVIDEPDGEA